MFEYLAFCVLRFPPPGNKLIVLGEVTPTCGKEKAMALICSLRSYTINCWWRNTPAYSPADSGLIPSSCTVFSINFAINRFYGVGEFIILLVVSIITKSPSNSLSTVLMVAHRLSPKNIQSAVLTKTVRRHHSAQYFSPTLWSVPDRHVRTVNFPTPAAVLKSNSLLPGKGRVSNARGNVGYYKLIGTIFCIATKLLICGCFLHKVRPVLVKQLLCHKTKEFRPK